MLNITACVDACILFPSAMYFVDGCPGCLLRLPDILDNTSNDFFMKQYEYLVIVIVIALKQYLNIPLTSIRNEDGVIHSQAT